MTIAFNGYNWNVDTCFWNSILDGDIRLLVLVGSSGAGKSTLTNYLVNNNTSYYEIKNVTTRKPRKEEMHTSNFLFVTSDEFMELYSKEKYAWTRTGKYPFFGYLKSELLYVRKNKKVGMLSFHHNGVALITKLLIENKLKSNIFNFVFIKGDAEEISNHSKDVEGLTSIKKTTYELYNNQIIANKLVMLGCNVMEVKNDYNIDTIADIGNTIVSWMGTNEDRF